MHQHRAMQRSVLAAASLSYVLVILDTSIVNLALARIAAALHTDIAGLQWVTNAYTLTFASLLLSGGVLGDRWGARPVYLAGLLVFTLASALCGIAPSVTFLTLARVLQGVGSALLVPSSLTLIKHAFPDAAERAGAVGLWAGCGGAAMAAGPLLGGVLVHLFDWRSIFLANLPLGLLGVGLTWRIKPSQSDVTPSHTRRFDLAGQISLVLALCGLIGVLIEAPALGWTSSAVVAGGVLSSTASAVFVWLESRRGYAMMPLSLFKNGIFTGSAIVSLASALTFYGLVFVFSLYCQQIQGLSPLYTGLAFLPLTAMVAAGSLLSNRLVKRYGPRRLVGAALTSYGIGFLGLLGSTSSAPGWLQALSLLAIGCSAGLITPATTAAMMGAIDKDRAGVAAGVLNAARQTGAALGVALFGALLTTHDSFETGMHLAFWLSIAVTLSAALVWWFALMPEASS